VILDQCARAPAPSRLPEVVLGGLAVARALLESLPAGRCGAPGELSSDDDAVVMAQLGAISLALAIRRAGAFLARAPAPEPAAAPPGTGAWKELFR